MDLTTRYLGLSLRSPLVPSASPLSEKLENVREMEQAGAAAVVFHSLFEEQIEATAPECRVDPKTYLEHIAKAKRTVAIPIIAQWKWAEAGYNVAGIDIRGFGRSAAAVPAPSRWGYVLTGIESPEASVLRGAVCDYGRTMQLARDLFAGQTARRLTYGFSFAGGLALMAEALWDMSDLLVLGVPTFGWAEGRYFLVKSGSGAEIAHYLKERPEATEDIMLVLRYFDAVNFAGMVSCETLIGLGLNDPVVPAETVYSIANHFAAPCEIMEFPVSHTALPEEQRWEEFETRWLALGRGESELRPLRVAKSRRKKLDGG